MVRESQKKRGASVEVVDEVIALVNEHKQGEWEAGLRRGFAWVSGTAREMCGPHGVDGDKRRKDGVGRESEE